MVSRVLPSLDWSGDTDVITVDPSKRLLISHHRVRHAGIWPGQLQEALSAPLLLIIDAVRRGVDDATERPHIGRKQNERGCLFGVRNRDQARPRGVTVGIPADAKRGQVLISRMQRLLLCMVYIRNAETCRTLWH